MTPTTERHRPPAEYRRGSREVQNLLVEAARSLFAAKGFAGATTRDIALEAGVPLWKDTVESFLRDLGVLPQR